MTLIGQTLKASTKSVTVEEDAITISYRKLYHGFKGDKRIPFSSITAVQYKEPGSWIAGYIQLTVQGALEWRGPADQDENSFQFDSNVADQFRELRDFLTQRIGSRPAASPPSIAEELEKLASLRERGVISELEFGDLKRKIISS